MIINTFPTLGVTYQIFIQSFADSNSDGIGDINGVTEKLSYIKDLGVDAIWLTPIHPSPSYHKYDVTDYYDVDPAFGTLADFRYLIEKAHELELKIIMDLVINHCSIEHPWFVAAKDEQNEYRDFFIWRTLEEIAQAGNLTKEATGDSDNRIIWNEVPGQAQRYYSFFWKGMPDLNFDNPEVRSEVMNIGKYWLAMGVDGFRLDAAKHIYPDDRVADTVAFWNMFQKEMRSVAPEVILIGEVWSDVNSQTAFATGFTGLFNFDLSYAILESVKRGYVVKANTHKNAWKVEEKGSPVDIFMESADSFLKINPDFHQHTFLSNHDQTRVLSFLRNNKAKAKLAASILLTLPGSPFIYYGEELGMRGRKPDEYLREPMPWSDHYLTSWIMPRHNKKGRFEPIEHQFKNKRSLWRHYQTLIHLRAQNAALSKGTIELLDLNDRELFAYQRICDEQRLIIVHNLSEDSKSVKSDFTVRDVIFSSDPTGAQVPERLVAHETKIYSPAALVSAPVC